MKTLTASGSSKKTGLCYIDGSACESCRRAFRAGPDTPATPKSLPPHSTGYTRATPQAFLSPATAPLRDEFWPCFWRSFTTWFAVVSLPFTGVAVVQSLVGLSGK